MPQDSPGLGAHRRPALRAGARFVAGEVVLADLTETSLRSAMVTPPQYACRKSYGDKKEPNGNSNSREGSPNLSWKCKAQKIMSIYSPRHIRYDDLYPATVPARIVRLE